MFIILGFWVLKLKKLISINSFFRDNLWVLVELGYLKYLMGNKKYLLYWEMCYSFEDIKVESLGVLVVVYIEFGIYNYFLL